MDQDETQLLYGLPLPESERLFFGLVARSWVACGHRIAALRNPNPEPPEDLYRLEIEIAMEAVTASYLCSRSPMTHRDAQRHAIDFLVPVGTPVYAAQAGFIEALADEHTKHGPGPQYAQFANYVTLRHENGDCSQYLHLQPGGASNFGLRLRHPVRRGQRIGTVGLTGQTDRPHLHFLVFRGQLGPAGYQSLKIRWG